MKTTSRIVISLFAALVGGASGLVLGTLYAGNYATNFEFLGVRGYEAGGWLGLLIGFALAGILIYLLLGLRSTKHAGNQR